MKYAVISFLLTFSLFNSSCGDIKPSYPIVGSYSNTQEAGENDPEGAVGTFTFTFSNIENKNFGMVMNIKLEGHPESEKYIKKLLKDFKSKGLDADLNEKGEIEFYQTGIFNSQERIFSTNTNLLAKGLKIKFNEDYKSCYKIGKKSQLYIRD